MSSIATEIAAYVAANGYHPRSSVASDRQSDAIVRDLLNVCPLLRSRAATGEIVCKLKHHQTVGTSDWVIDIALGTCAGQAIPPLPSESIRRTEPAMIQIAIELKSIWTEHGKARRNRIRDFDAFHGHAHQYSPRTVAGAFLVVNGADHFYSPLNKNRVDKPDLTTHAKPNKATAVLVTETINLFRSIKLRNHHDEGHGIEGLGIVVVNHDNINIHPTPEKYAHLQKPTFAPPGAPALKVGDPLHYDTMLQRLCQQYRDRFGP